MIATMTVAAWRVTVAATHLMHALVAGGPAAERDAAGKQLRDAPLDLPGRQRCLLQVRRPNDPFKISQTD